MIASHTKLRPTGFSSSLFCLENSVHSTESRRFSRFFSFFFKDSSKRGFDVHEGGIGFQGRLHSAPIIDPLEAASGSRPQTLGRNLSGWNGRGQAEGRAISWTEEEQKGRREGVFLPSLFASSILSFGISRRLEFFFFLNSSFQEESGLRSLHSLDNLMLKRRVDGRADRMSRPSKRNSMGLISRARKLLYWALYRAGFDLKTWDSTDRDSADFRQEWGDTYELSSDF